MLSSRESDIPSHCRSKRNQGGLLCSVVSQLSSQLTNLSGENCTEKCYDPYSGNMAWYQAMKDPRFAAAVQALGVLSWSRPKLRLLAVLQNPENQSKSGLQICRLAGYKDHVAWNRAIKDERFVAELEALGVTLRRRSVRASHLEVISATNFEEELKKDIWDIRRLKHDYPKHVAPSNYVIDFTCPHSAVCSCIFRNISCREDQ